MYFLLNKCYFQFKSVTFIHSVSPNPQSIQSGVRMRVWLILFTVGAIKTLPLQPKPPNLTSPSDPPKSAFLLAEKVEENVQPVVPVNQENTGGGLMQIMEKVVNHPMMSKVWSFIENIAGNAMSTQTPVISANEDELPKSFHKDEGISSGKVRRLPNHNRFLQNDDAEKFEASLSHDDSVSSVKATSTGKISDQEWSKTLFGERGVLTEIFHLFDEQRRAAEANAHHQQHPNVQAAAATHQSDSSPKIGGPENFDLKKIFDSIFSSSKSGQFGDPGPELPEFLGICNRLSCGDIYKAIDQFRKSEFFSNFQTALQLIQDPKGWEIIGKALENPELISEFAGNSGLKEMFGSALGGDKGKSEIAERKKTEILPEDGNFGTDFTEMIDGLKPKNKETDKPDVSFSIDKQGSGGDYYTQLSKRPDDGEDEDVDHVDVEIPVPKSAVIEPLEKPVPPSQKIEKSDSGLPELSFSEDEEEGESVAVEKSIDVRPPRKIIDVTIPKTTTKPLQQRVIRLSTTIETTVKPSKVTTKWTPPTTTPPTTTKRNYRKEDDYYSMYYDH